MRARGKLNVDFLPVAGFLTVVRRKAAWTHDVVENRAVCGVIIGDRLGVAGTGVKSPF